MTEQERAAANHQVGIKIAVTQMQVEAAVATFKAAAWGGDPVQIEAAAEVARTAFQHHLDSHAGAAAFARTSLGLPPTGAA